MCFACLWLLINLSARWYFSFMPVICASPIISLLHYLMWCVYVCVCEWYVYVYLQKLGYIKKIKKTWYSSFQFWVISLNVMSFKYIHFPANENENLFCTKIQLRNIKKTSRYNLQLERAGRNTGEALQDRQRRGLSEEDFSCPGNDTQNWQVRLCESKSFCTDQGIALREQTAWRTEGSLCSLHTHGRLIPGTHWRKSLGMGWGLTIEILGYPSNSFRNIW